MAVEKFKNITQLKNLGVYGIIRESEVDSNLIPDGALTSANNVHFDRKGAITQRNGLTVIGLRQGGTCYGLYNAMFSNSGSNRLMSIFIDGKIKIFQTGTWIPLLTDTVNQKTRFATFADCVIRVNGTDDMKCWDGGSIWSTSGGSINVDDMAGYKTKFVEIFKNRVYTAGDTNAPDRLYYSSIVDSWGAITWSPTTYYIDINPNDGENITALKRFSVEMLIFKPNHIYRFRTSSLDPDPLIKVGTKSQESVIEGKKGLYFHHETGFYRYNGTYPQEISRPISDFVDAIPSKNHGNIIAWRDSDHIYWSIGNVTVSGINYTNVVLRYTESSQVWTTYSYPYQVTMACDYDDGTTLFRLVGDATGYASKYGVGTTDYGNAISYDFETKWYNFGNVTERKVLKEVIIICEKSQGIKAYYRTDDSNTWHSLGRLTSFRTKFTQLNIAFHRIRFKLQGISSQEAAIFEGFELADMVSEGDVD